MPLPMDSMWAVSTAFPFASVVYGLVSLACAAVLCASCHSSSRANVRQRHVVAVAKGVVLGREACSVLPAAVLAP